MGNNWIIFHGIDFIQSAFIPSLSLFFYSIAPTDTQAILSWFYYVCDQYHLNQAKQFRVGS